MATSLKAERSARPCALAAAACRDKASHDSTLLVWLLQTACIAVLEEACETLRPARGSNPRQLPARVARFTLPLNFPQNALLSRFVGREYRLLMVGYVAGRRRMRRVVSGWF